MLFLLNLDYCIQMYFVFNMLNIKLTRSIQDLFTRRLRGARPSYLSYPDRLENFILETLKNEELSLVCQYFLGLWFFNLNISWFVSFSWNVFEKRENGLKLDNEKSTTFSLLVVTTTSTLILMKLLRFGMLYHIRHSISETLRNSRAVSKHLKLLDRHLF